MYGVIGATGYVGQAIAKNLKLRGIDYVVIGRAETATVETLSHTLKLRGVSRLINSAGYTGKPNVDACELHKRECLEGNALFPGIVREACEQLGVAWGHVSSGCIFTGRRSDGQGFQEEDPANFTFRQNNCSFYSGCKALGEELLIGAEKCYVWRLRIPFENTANPRNYLQKLIKYERLLDAENSLSELGEFAAACVDSFEKALPYGTYNLTNPGSVTTREVVELIRKSGVCTRAFSFFDSEEEFLSKAAKTPRSNCVLDSTKALRANLKLRPVLEAIEESLANWVPA